MAAFRYRPKRLAVKPQSPTGQASETLALLRHGAKPEKPGSTESVIGGLPAGGRYAIVLGALVLIAVGLNQASTIFAPTFLALTLVLTLRPMSNWLLAHRVPGWLAVVISALVLLGLLLLLMYAVIYSLVQLSMTLPHYSDSFMNLYYWAIDQLAKWGVDISVLSGKLASMLDPGQVVSVLQALLGQLSSLGGALFLIVMIIVFMFMDMSVTAGRVEQLRRTRPHLLEALARFAKATRTYWVVTTVFGAIVAVIDYVALLAMGIPMALTWGIFAFVTNYIPNVGFILGLIPPALLALLEKGPAWALAVIIIYVVVNVVVQSGIQPKFTGHAVGINTTVSFVSLALWSTIIGAMGAILAVPLTLFFKALLVDSDPQAKWIDVFLRDNDKEIKEASAC